MKKFEVTEEIQDLFKQANQKTDLKTNQIADGNGNLQQITVPTNVSCYSMIQKTCGNRNSQTIKALIEENYE